MENLTPAQMRRFSGVPDSAQQIYLRAIKGEASPRQAIKSMCLECMDYDRVEIAGCTSTACPLNRYRPFQKSNTPSVEAAD